MVSCPICRGHLPESSHGLAYEHWDASRWGLWHCSSLFKLSGRFALLDEACESTIIFHLERTWPVTPKRDLQRVRRLLEQQFQVQAKILELNRRHPLIQNLARLVTTRPDDGVIEPAIEQLFDNLLLLEGLHPNPVQMVPRIQVLLETATGK